jgi:Uma2 family endonuclease
MEAGLRAKIDAMLSELESFPLIAEDGEPLESSWHRACINLLIASVLSWFRDREDFYVGGNMFVYYSLDQARNRDYRGPDFFFVDHVNLHPQRRYWATWLENGRFPNVIIELLSPTTAREDRTTKRALYEETFHTRNYYCYDPDTHQLEGWELANGQYVPLQPNEHGWLRSAALGLWVGTWQGAYLRENATWLRFYDDNGQVVAVREEIAEQLAANERQRADNERRRADDAEAELVRLRALLAQQARPGDATGPPS